MLNNYRPVRVLVCICLMLFTGDRLYSQASPDSMTLIKTLEFLRDRDQKTRTGRDSAAFMQEIDQSNLHMLEPLLNQYGWLGKSLVGARGNQTCFLIIQHADSATQMKYFPNMQQSVEAKESSAADLALLQDRILMRQGKKQMYGTQVIMNKEGGSEFYPIEQEDKVDERRAAVGLPPMEIYAQHFGIPYHHQ